MKFSDIAGQTALGARLRRGIESGRVPHAQLFLGQEGSGNLALALAYAGFLLCQNRLENDRCGECSSCHKFSGYVHPDVHFSFPFPSSSAEVATELYSNWREALLENPYLNYEQWMQKLDAANKQGNIPVKECHALLKTLSLKPFESEYKVLIMWLPEYLGNEGNVLLKSLEEPAPNTVYLLAGEKTEKILTTILSRVQLVRVPPIASGDLASWLEKYTGKTTEECSSISLMAAGNLLKAVELAENEENQFLDPFRNWMAYCYKKDLPGAFHWAESFAGSGREKLKGFFIYSLEIVRALLVNPFLGSAQGLSQKETEFVQKFGKIISTHAQAELLYGWLNDAAYEIERNASAKLVFNDLSFKISRILH